MNARSASVFAALSIVFAGCVSAEGDAGAKDADPDVAGPASVDPNSEFGLVEGTVISEETQPLAGAQVGLADTEHVTTSDASGRFVLREVMPGTYTLVVGALGYEASARNVEVLAGQVSTATLTLRAIEVADVAYTQIFPFVGFFECALGTNVWISSCSYPYTAAWGTAKENGANLSQYGAPADIQKNQHRFNFTIKQGVGQLVSELTWQSTSAAATRMLLMHLCGDYDYVVDECTEGIRYGSGNGVVGENPVRAVIDGEEFVDEGKDSEEYDLTKRSEIWVMSYVGLPFGNPQVAFQQKFEVWDSVFYNGVAPDGYTVLVDT